MDFTEGALRKDSPIVCIFSTLMLNLPITVLPVIKDLTPGTPSMLVQVTFFHRINFRLLAWLLGVWLCLLSVAENTTAQAVQVMITSPVEGSLLQGIVQIDGSSAIEGFRQAEISFAYQSDPTNTWFLVQQAAEPVKDGRLANWDTTTISDGNYRLRLQVTLQNGQMVESVVSGLRVRNYTQIDAGPTQEGAGGMRASQTPAATTQAGLEQGLASPTGLPTNPAMLTPQQLAVSAERGVLLVLGAVLAACLYLGARALLRR